MVSGLHGDQILGARSNQQDSFSILAGDDALVLRAPRIWSPCNPETIKGSWEKGCCVMAVSYHSTEGPPG